MPAPITPGRLAPGHLEALRLSANGLTSREIARQVGATKTAVDVRLTNAARCLGARSRVHAVAVAFRLGLLTADDIRLPDVPAQQAREAACTPAGATNSLPRPTGTTSPETVSETHSAAPRVQTMANTHRTDR